MTCHAKKEDCGGTCNVGSLGHYPQDAMTFAKWKLDFIKMDWCSASVAHLSCEKQYGEMAAALNATGRPITFYMSCGGNGAKSTLPQVRGCVGAWARGAWCVMRAPCASHIAHRAVPAGTHAIGACSVRVHPLCAATHARV